MVITIIADITIATIESKVFTVNYLSPFFTDRWLKHDLN
jgi:hypothetical protein